MQCVTCLYKKVTEDILLTQLGTLLNEGFTINNYNSEALVRK
jgi:hypothetical protein